MCFLTFPYPLLDLGIYFPFGRGKGVTVPSGSGALMATCALTCRIVATASSTASITATKATAQVSSTPYLKPL